MSTMSLIAAILLGIGLLLFLILYGKIHAFVALLISSITVGLAAGLDANQVMNTVSTGMASTLGFVATVVGLGAIFGGILERSGGAKVITVRLLALFGESRSPVAMLMSGFVIAIPVFFDVAFIILVPIIYALQRKTGKSLLLYAIPLLAGLAITHSFIPPTPGPVAVADIIGADLGYVILVGLIAGVPTAILSGIVFGKFIAKRIHLNAPPVEVEDTEDTTNDLPSFVSILTIISVPIVLILLNTASKSGLLPIENTSLLYEAVVLLGHPFVALIIANLLAWWLLGLRQGFSRNELLKISNDSLKPAGTIILLTGAGGVFKQVLVDTKAGEQLASLFAESGMPILLFAFIAAAIVRILQGSATVAMITAAGLVGSIIIPGDLSGLQLGALVIAIASGASTLSHVNDSGFWLVSQYLGMNEKQTFRSWTMMTVILSLTGLLTVSLVYLFL